ncbi:TraB/GumN family protein [uncultured Arcticibacterium sp.]|uniref:TraB/GumN family protein n=1 Tax=uncultured Arcticibacterium sp. TaxID=2173042 RepID=UPI0030FCE249
MFKITGNGLSSPSYLYGTIHFACERDIDLRILKEILPSCSRTVLEITNTEKLIQFKNLEKFVNPSNKAISEYLSPAEILKLEDAYNEYAYESVDFSQVKNLGPDFFVKAIYYYPKTKCITSSVEQMIKNLSIGARLPVFGIESFSEHFEIDSFHYDDEAVRGRFVALIKSLDKIDSLKEAGKILYDETSKLYSNGDIEKLYELVVSEMDSVEVYNTLVKRNKTWLPRMVKIMSKKTTLFAFGAAHFGGETGIINLLRSEGFKVEAYYGKKRNRN